MKGEMTKEEVAGALVYTIVRMGSPRQRYYQVCKTLMEVVLDTYWVELKGRGQCFCDCMGFRRQSFPKMEHKHIKIALDYNARGEPRDARYRIYGQGHKTVVEYMK